MSVPKSAAIFSYTALMEMGLEQAMLYTPGMAPEGAASAANMFALTTFSTYVKSLVVSPSPFITGDSLARSFFTNIGMTAAYLDSGSCRGPNTLKYLSPIMSKP